MEKQRRVSILATLGAAMRCAITPVATAAVAAALTIALTVGAVGAQSGGMTVTIGGNTTGSSQDNVQDSATASGSDQSVGQSSAADDLLTALLGDGQQRRTRALDNATGQHQTQTGPSQGYAPTNSQTQTISATVSGGPAASALATAGGADLLDTLIRELMTLLDD